MSLTKQEIFNGVWDHLLKQRKQAMMQNWHNKFCAYRSPDGLKCAIGGILPDKLYNPNMEGKKVAELLTHPDIAEYFGTENETLLWELQDVHDNSDVSWWRKDLVRIATAYSLQIPEIPASVRTEDGEWVYERWFFGDEE